MNQQAGRVRSHLLVKEGLVMWPLLSKALGHMRKVLQSPRFPMVQRRRTDRHLQDKCFVLRPESLTMTTMNLVSPKLSWGLRLIVRLTDLHCRVLKERPHIHRQYLQAEDSHPHRVLLGHIETQFRPRHHAVATRRRRGQLH